MVCVAGFEPAAPAVQVRYSDQTELHTDEMERVIGIEPILAAWKAVSSPRANPRIGAGSRFRTHDILVTKEALYQLSYTGEMVERVGIEPTGSNLARITRLPRARPNYENGGRLRVRTPDLAAPSVFKTDCLPLKRRLPIMADSGGLDPQRRCAERFSKPPRHPGRFTIHENKSAELNQPREPGAGSPRRREEAAPWQWERPTECRVQATSIYRWMAT